MDEPVPVGVGAGLHIVVNKERNLLFLYRARKLVKRYPVATGAQRTGPAPTWADFQDNSFTPEGPFVIADKTRLPVYYGSKTHPPAAAGAPDNPLGTRWLGFTVLSGDNAKIWGIHGTDDPSSIGKWASDGCVRMFTRDVEELFDLVEVGTPLLILSGKEPGR